MTVSIKKFQEEIEKHLIAFKTNTQYLPPTTKKKWLYHDIADNVFPPVKHGFFQYVYDNGMPLHDYVNHVRSSQIFCINTFFHLLINEPKELLDLLSTKVNKRLKSIESYEFEFSPDKNILGEWKSDNNRPEEYVTATDLLIITKSNDNKKYGFLIEVKFTEGDFTKCGGYSSNANKGDLKKACQSGKILLSDFNTCYLQGASGNSKLKRKYFDYFKNYDFNEKSFENECPFKNNNQCLRNQSLLRALIKSKKIDNGYFILVHYDENEHIINEWDKYYEILSSNAQEEIFRIPVSEFIMKSKDENFKKYFNDRYRIE